MSRRFFLAATAALLASIGGASAQTVQPPDYSKFGGGTFLRFLNAGEGGLRESPHIGLSFGGRTIRATLDTGSTGIVVSASSIPDFDQLPVLGDGKLTYTSSGRIMRGSWVTTTVTLVGRDGEKVTTAPMPVLGVTRIDCLDDARECTPTEGPRDTAMVGIGFGREKDAQAESTPDKNPVLQAAGVQRKGYVLTTEGIQIGLTAESTKGAFQFVKLAQMDDVQDWAGVPACLSLGGQTPPACGSMLLDTGVPVMFLSVPPSQAPASPLPDGTSVEVLLGTDSASQPLYSFTSGDASSAVAPSKIFLHVSDRRVFVNTGVHLMNGFDYLYDADGGYAAFRPH